MAAGMSRRLGRPKQSLPFGPGTLLSHVMNDIEASRALDRVVLVTGGAAVEAADGLVLNRTRVVYNDTYDAGCASSLLAGLDAAGDAAAIVMLLGDMPGVTANIIDDVVGEWRDAPTWAALTEYRDGVGHPFIFSAEAFSALRLLHGDKAVWKIVDTEPAERVRRIPIDEALPHDIDTWDDYVATCNRFGFQAVDPA